MKCVLLLFTMSLCEYKHWNKGRLQINLVS